MNFVGKRNKWAKYRRGVVAGHILNALNKDNNKKYGKLTR